MSLVDRAARTSLRLIRKYGTQITVRRPGVGAVDTTTGRAGIAADLVAHPYAVVGQLSARKWGLAFEELSQVMVSHRLIYIEAAGMTFTPKVGDEVSGIEGMTWRVVASSVINPDGAAVEQGGTVVLYETLIKK